MAGITPMLFILLALCCGAVENYYETEHDNDDTEKMHIDQIRQLFECILGRNPCSEEDASVKRVYPEVVLKACHRCTEAQKQIMDSTLNRAEKEIPDIYEAYKNMFDPSAFKAFREALIGQL